MTIFFRYTNRNMGGWVFLKVNTENKKFVVGNTASTAESLATDLTVTVKTQRELNDIKDRLEMLNYENLGRN